MRNSTFYFLLILSYLPLPLFAQNSSTTIDKYLNELVATKKLNSTDISWIITSKNTSRISNVKNEYFRQSLNGLEIFGTESGVHTLANGKELRSYNNFVLNAAEKIIGNSSPTISPIDAVKSAAANLNYIIQEPLIEFSSNNNLSRETTVSNGGFSKKNIPVKLMYEKLNDGTVALIWYLSIQHNSSPDWYSIRVNAHTGEITGKVNWTTSCGFDHSHEEEIHHSHRSFGPINYNQSNLLQTGSYEVTAYPLESPLHGNRTIVANVADPLASPFGWHDIDGVNGAEYTVTNGNNVNAYQGIDVNNGYQPNGGSALTFHFPFNMNYSDSNPYKDASLTNLFYWSNIIHDVVYQYGFDETSGNFQKNNYGRGGLDNDPVNAQGLISWNCNAFFTTPPDGESGILEMYYCGNRDGSFDNIVTIHEYAHGISIRSTGGPANSDCLWNGEQMGEGWSDWYGLMLTMDADDTRTDRRTIGTYLLNQPIDGPGIRAVPYTTEMSVNSYTFENVKTMSSPHDIGTVWATILWEMTWSLIDEYGFDSDIYNGTGGNNIALVLVTEGLKLQPCNPGFVDARDAILAADIAIYGGANQCLLWEAFAKRGLGSGASQGSSFDPSDGISSFDSPSSAVLNLTEKVCISDGIVPNLGGGVPKGGVYSGSGVTDDGNGTTFTLDVNALGIGVHNITYTVPQTSCVTASSITETIEIVEFLELSCPENIVETLSFGSNYTIPDYYESGFLTITSYCIEQGVTVVQTPAPGTSLPIGTHLIEFLITDHYNNNFNCSFELEINTNLGTDELSLNDNSVKLFPNPTNDKITIVNQSKIKINSIKLLDSSGKLIQNFNLNENREEFDISLKSYPAGVYFIKLNSEKEEIIKSVIKK